MYMSTLKKPTWRRHIDQLRPYGVVEDTDPGETPTLQSGISTPFSKTLTRNRTLSQTSLSIVPPIPPVKWNYRKPTPTEDNYGPANPRRSARIQQRLERKPRLTLSWQGGDVSLYCVDIIGTTIVYETTTTQQVTPEYSRLTFSLSINCRLFCASC